jgi:hypothetical protein
MTIGLIDPALLLPRSSDRVASDLAQVLIACEKSKIRLLPFREYWTDMWRQFGRPLEEGLPPTERHAVQELRRLGQKHANELAWSGDKLTGTVWVDGFKQLFDSIAGMSWTERMAQAALRAVAHGERVVMFTRLINGRNVILHRAGETTLAEITRWVLHVQQGHDRHQILCVSDPRNLTESWTARYDSRLPSQLNGAGYPFCVPNNWWHATVAARDTVRSKPCWMDGHENGWARPNINSGAGYHWDVYIKDRATAEKIGLDQVNIVQHGAPPEEGVPGWIHHVPSDKQGKIDEKRAGWICV